MRTSEERARLIHRRTAEIKQERRIKRQRRLDAACNGGLPASGHRHRHNDAGTDEERRGRKHRPFFGNGKPDRKPCRAGYIVMGLLAFFLGVCVTVLLYRLHRRCEGQKQEEAGDGEL